MSAYSNQIWGKNVQSYNSWEMLFFGGFSLRLLSAIKIPKKNCLTTLLTICRSVAINCLTNVPGVSIVQ